MLQFFTSSVPTKLLSYQRIELAAPHLIVAEITVTFLPFLATDDPTSFHIEDTTVIAAGAKLDDKASINLRADDRWKAVYPAGLNRPACDISGRYRTMEGHSIALLADVAVDGFVAALPDGQPGALMRHQVFVLLAHHSASPGSSSSGGSMLDSVCNHFDLPNAPAPCDLRGAGIAGMGVSCIEIVPWRSFSHRQNSQ